MHAFPIRIVWLVFVCGLVCQSAAGAESERSKSGEVVGVVTAKGDIWLDVKPERGETERYLPRWVGGSPREGGGLDRRMIRKLREIGLGDRVRLRWVFEDRRRVVEIARESGEKGK